MGAIHLRSTLSPTVKALAMLVFCGLGCSGGGDSQLRVPEGTPIILISVDTLRSDHLHVYGYDGVETPAIDQFRRDSVLFERAYTHVPVTLPAHTSLLTGLLPSTHGVRDNLGYTVDTTKGRLLQQTLKDAGYATGAGVSALSLRRATGIGTGFDFYHDVTESPEGPGAQSLGLVERPGGETLDAVRPWLRSVADRPFFLFFHTYEPHTPYEPPAEYAARYPSPYDGEVAAADDVVGALLEELRSLSLYERALIVFLSDHGEGLGDHGEDEHGVFLYRSTLQVPLILKLPQSERAGETVSYPVQLIDVYPTLMSALGLECGEDLRGIPLLARSRPKPRHNLIYAETFFPRIHFGWSDLATLIAGRYHYIDAPQPELFDLLNDPDEMNNLVGSEPALESELLAALSSYDRELEAPTDVDPETRRGLAALGYVGEATITSDDVLPDPKTRVHSMADIMQAYTLYHDGNLEAAVPALQKVLEENPKIEEAWGYLVLAQLELGRPDEAVEAVLTSLKKLPESRRLPLKAARILDALGRLDEASGAASGAIPYDPPAAHQLLAEIALKKGDLKEAELQARKAISSGSREPEPRLILADAFLSRGQASQAVEMLTRTLEEGITSDPVRARLVFSYASIGNFATAQVVLDSFEGPASPELLVEVGKLAMARQMLGEARQWCERARRIDPNQPTATLTLGIVALNEGRLTEARKLLQDALSAIPSSLEGWSSLGMVFARMGDPGGAIIAWERALQINPEFIEVTFNLGLAHAQLGHRSQAIAYLEDFASRAQPGPHRDQALGIAQQLRTSQNR
jgi:arylsulfatase A-like enzyme/predicted Zn-dependent protease